jgi:2-oxoglutarate dehydrogenase E2 component (dihydrolipoamide succinyltransferase)
MGDSISEGVVEEFVKGAGEFVEADEIVARIETDKVTVDITSPVAGVIKTYLAAEGDTVEVGADFFELDTDATSGSAAPATPAAPKAAAPEPPKAAPVATPAPAAPAAPPKAAPTGPPKPAPAAPSTPSVTAKKAPTEIKGTRTETRVPMNRMRIRIADRLKDAQNTNAMLTTFNEIDMSAYIALRKEFGEAFAKKHEIKLGFMSGFVKASTLALKEQPVVNAVIEGGDMVYRDFVDISVAVSAPKGLIVPVLRNCQDMEMHHVEKELSSLGNKARDGKITLEDMAGGTFTISNGGVFGSMMGTPIINPPQSAILGMHATKNRPVCVGSKIEARPIMYVALTYDHRIIDGREAVVFLKQIKETIEDPRRILLDL